MSGVTFYVKDLSKLHGKSEKTIGRWLDRFEASAQGTVRRDPSGKRYLTLEAYEKHFGVSATRATVSLWFDRMSALEQNLAKVNKQIAVLLADRAGQTRTPAAQG